MKNSKYFGINKVAFFASCALAVFAYLTIPHAKAVSVSSSFNIMTTVAPVCTTVTGTTMAFGVYNPMNNIPTDATNAISVVCTSGLAYSIALSTGTSNTYAGRAMANAKGDTNINYNIYTDAAHVSVWGDGTAGTNLNTGIGSGTVQYYTGFGRIPARQTVGVAAGNYLDTIILSVTFN